jgi:hypothetical protein
VLVQEVIDVPTLIGDPCVIACVFHGVVEDQEIGHQDLVHPAIDLKRVQVVLTTFVLDVPQFAGERGAQRVDSLTLRFEDSRDGSWASQSMSRSGTSW